MGTRVLPPGKVLGHGGEELGAGAGLAWELGGRRGGGCGTSRSGADLSLLGNAAVPARAAVALASLPAANAMSAGLLPHASGHAVPTQLQKHRGLHRASSITGNEPGAGVVLVTTVRLRCLTTEVVAVLLGCFQSQAELPGGLLRSAPRAGDGAQPAEKVWQGTGCAFWMRPSSR